VTECFVDMSDLVSEPVQEPPGVTNLGSAPSLEGVSVGVGSCFESAKTNTDLPQPMTTKSPDLEGVKSEQDALKSDEGIITVDYSVSKGVI